MKKIFFAIFLSCLLVFNLNRSVLSSIRLSEDAIPATLLPFNLLDGKGLYFDTYIHEFKKSSTYIYFFQHYKNHYVSFYPFFSGFIALPLYLPVYILLGRYNLTGMENLLNWSFLMGKISASFFASLSVGLLFLLLQKLFGNKKLSIAFSLIFAFATQTFSISSQVLWQHGVANLFLILSLFFYVRNKKAGSLFFAVCSFWARLTYFPYLIVLLTAVAVSSKRKLEIAILLLISVLGVSALLLFNFFYTGSVLGGYANSSKAQLGSIVNILGVIFSPARGLIFYSPIFIFGIIGIGWVFYKRYKLSIPLKNVLLINSFYLVSVILINALFLYWWGGNSWGSRLLTDSTVCAVILSAFLYREIKNLFFKIFFWLLILYSVGIQIIGVFYFPRGSLNEYPDNVDTHQERLWDFQDNPITRSFLTGPEIAPFAKWVYFFQGIPNPGRGFPACSLEEVKEDQLLSYRMIN